MKSRHGPGSTRSCKQKRPPAYAWEPLLNSFQPCNFVLKSPQSIPCGYHLAAGVKLDAVASVGMEVAVE